MSNSTDKHAMDAPKGGVVVRMYNTGLGDCFLLGFPADDGETSYMMIDCGSLKGTRSVSGRMKRIMKSISRTTKGRGIEVLVATHKHWDHLSGFAQAKDELQELDIRQVWLGWTENPADEKVTQFATEEHRLANSLRAAAEKLNMYGNRAASENIHRLMAFEFGPDSKIGSGDTYSNESALGATSTKGSSRGATSTKDLLEIVRECVPNPRYLEPSMTPEQLPGVGLINVYVLGPPRDLTFMKKVNPSSGKKSEAYVVGTPKNELSGFNSAAGLLYRKPAEDMTYEERRLLERTFPFDAEYGMWKKEAHKQSDNQDFFRKHYGYDRTDNAEAWRKIDWDWLETAENLALQFDCFRNNTSVVLAFEIGTGGPVLLFPGDAQVGSWLSWDQLKGDTCAEDLLSRTVLYKVGHHGSHNATLKEKGLERMALNKPLVAMVPVDEEMARKPKGRNIDGWDMPYANLMDALMRKTQGRILRSDLGIPTKPDPDAGLGKDEWEAFRKKHSKVVIDNRSKTPLFVQYTMLGWPED